MNFPGDSKWMLSVSGGDTFALYVRDALGVSTRTADVLPRLDPPVPRADVVVPDGFAEAWDTWWVHVLGGGRVASGSEFVRGRWPAGLPEHLLDDYRAWDPFRATGHARDLARSTTMESLDELVADLRRELGREPVFTLQLIEYPLQGQFWRRLDRDTAIVSTELLSSRNIIAPLESVIRDLVGVQ